MEQLTKLQCMLIGYFKQLQLDEAAILFIMLTLETESSQGAMVLYLRDNKNPTQEDLMQVAIDFRELSEEMGLE